MRGCRLREKNHWGFFRDVRTHLLLEDNLLHAIKSLYFPIQILLRAVHKEIYRKYRDTDHIEI